MTYLLSRHSTLLTCLLLICLLSPGCAKEKPKSRMEKRVCIYLNKLEDSAVALENQLDAVASAKRLNTRERMREAVNMIKNTRTGLKKADQDVNAYIAFVNANRGALKAETLDQYILIKDLLNPDLRRKRQAMRYYLERMETWLVYSADHYAELKARDVQSRKSYDALLIAVNRSQKEYEKTNNAYHLFVEGFLKRHPDLKTKFKRRYKTMQKELGWL